MAQGLWSVSVNIGIVILYKQYTEATNYIIQGFTKETLLTQ